jgi:hypothetical protein
VSESHKHVWGRWYLLYDGKAERKCTLCPKKHVISQRIVNERLNAYEFVLKPWMEEKRRLLQPKQSKPPQS